MRQPQLDMIGSGLPAVLLQQYPALAGIDWSTVPLGPPPDVDYSGRSLFDYSSGGNAQSPNEKRILETEANDVARRADPSEAISDTPEHPRNNRLEFSPSIANTSSKGKRLSSRELPRTFECSICDKSFTRRALYDNHLRTHTNERPYVCSFENCEDAFKTKNDQSRHERSRHRLKRFVCGGVSPHGKYWGCGKRFARSDGLLEHHTKTSKGRACMVSRDNV